MMPSLLPTYDLLPTTIQRVDIARYFILKRHGGVYMDLDFYSIDSLDKVINHDDELIFSLEDPSASKQHNKDYIVTNAVIASSKNNKFWDKMIQHCQDMISNYMLPKFNRMDPNSVVLYTTGPFALTQAIDKFQPKVKLLAHNFFSPLNYKQIEHWYHGIDIYIQNRSSIAIHLSNGSWWKQNFRIDNKNLLVKKTNVKIPKIFHLLWKTDTLPNYGKKLVRKLKQLHPDYKIMIWTDQNMETFIKNYSTKFKNSLYTKYHRFDTMIQRCDLFRVVILYALGGIYLDLDIEITKPLNTITSDCFLVCEKILTPQEKQDFGHSDSVRVANYAFGSIAGHDFFKLLIERMIKNSEKPVNHHNDVLETTGTGLVTRVYHEQLTMDSNILLLYPIVDQKPKCSCRSCYGIASCTVGSFGHHMHHGTWRKSIKPMNVKNQIENNI